VIIKFHITEWINSYVLHAPHLGIMLPYLDYIHRANCMDVLTPLF